MENVLEQSLQQQTIHKIEEINLLINTFIDGGHTEDGTINLFGGLPGAALFLYEYAHYKPEKKEECYEKIASIIEKAFDYIDQTPYASMTYCTGVIGTLWLTEYMRKKGVLDMDNDYLSPEMLGHLSKWSLQQTINKNHCDLLHGGFGFWATLLECEGIPNKEQLIYQQLEALNKIAINTPNGRNWKINEAYFKGGDESISVDSDTSINLGLAHGICAILVLLAKTNLQGYFKTETEENIHEGLKLIKSLKITNQDSNYFYPTTVLNGEPSGSGRLAWCYGVFCTATAYWMAWKATGNEDYRNEALTIIDFSAKLDISNAGLYDAGLCHGTAGAAEVFRRFYYETGNSIYKQASDIWITNTLQMAKYTDGNAGYKVFRAPENGGPIAEYGFLEGITGIGLALLSSLSDKPSDWSRVLQIA